MFMISREMICIWANLPHTCLMSFCFTDHKVVTMMSWLNILIWCQIGDYNFCYLKGKRNRAKLHLEAKKFAQLINEPTHIEGHLLDQAYLQDKQVKLDVTTEIHSKYYTDHKGLAIILKKRVMRDQKQTMRRNLK